MEEVENGLSDYEKRPMWQWVVVFLVVIIAVFGLIYYFGMAKKGSSGSTSIMVSPTNTPKEAGAQTSPTGSMETQSVTIVGSEFAFSPSEVTLKIGQPAQITFKNEGAYPHNLVITELGFKTKVIKPGEEDTVSFTPTITGQFNFLCTVPGHADKGMKGVLTVQ
jgi:plastocyanin